MSAPGDKFGLPRAEILPLSFPLGFCIFAAVSEQAFEQSVFV